MVTWNDPPTSDNSGGRVTVTYSVSSGSHFSLGGHDVTVYARDAAGNTAECEFDVTVEGKMVASFYWL